jgi:hypothetical protein
MTQNLPLWVNILFAGLFFFYFTGAWAVQKDMEKLLARQELAWDSDLSGMIRNVKWRRIASLLVGVFLVFSFFSQCLQP